MLIIVKFLLDTVSCHNKYLCVILNPSSRFHVIYCFMVLTPNFVCVAMGAPLEIEGHTYGDGEEIPAPVAVNLERA